MQNVASPAPEFSADVVGRLPPGLDLDGLARRHGAIRRSRRVADGTTLLRLALARGPGGLSLRDTAGWASLQGIAQISNPGLKYRLDNAVAFLDAVLAELLATRSASRGLHWPGRSLCVADGTVASRPGSTGADWRVHGVFDLERGGFAHLELTDARGAERLTRGAPRPGEVRVGDRGFARPGALHEFRAASAMTADFIVRVPWNGFHLRRPDGGRFDLIAHLRALPAAVTLAEVVVAARVNRATTVPMRLVMLRKPAAATAATHRRLLAAASRKQTRLDPRSLIAAEFLVLATSLPAATYPADQVLAAYRLRWQIELAFKRLKSLLNIDRLPTQTEPASRSWLTAHLILALLCDDISQEVLESFP